MKALAGSGHLLDCPDVSPPESTWKTLWQHRREMPYETNNIMLARGEDMPCYQAALIAALGVDLDTLGMSGIYILFTPALHLTFAWCTSYRCLAYAGVKDHRHWLQCYACSRFRSNEQDPTDVSWYWSRFQFVTGSRYSLARIYFVSKTLHACYNPTCNLGVLELAAVDVFKMTRGVFVVYAFAFDEEDVRHEAWDNTEGIPHYIVYHAARRLLLGLPNVLVLDDNDVKDPCSFMRNQLQTLPMCLQV